MRLCVIVAGLWSALEIQICVGEYGFCEGPVVADAMKDLCESTLYEDVETAGAACLERGCTLLHNFRGCDSQYTWRICPGRTISEFLEQSEGQGNADACTMLAAPNPHCDPSGATTQSPSGATTQSQGVASTTTVEAETTTVGEKTVSAPQVPTFRSLPFVTVTGGFRAKGAAPLAANDTEIARALASAVGVSEHDVAAKQAPGGQTARLRRLSADWIDVLFAITTPFAGAAQQLQDTILDASTPASLAGAMNQELGLPAGTVLIEQLVANEAPHSYTVVYEDVRTTCKSDQELTRHHDGQTDDICRERCDLNPECEFYFFNDAETCFTYSGCGRTRSPQFAGTTYWKAQTVSSGWQVSRPCSTDGDCVYSSNWPDNYGNDETCFMLLSSDRLVQSPEFSSEHCCDSVVINGEYYHGSTSISAVTPTTGISWSSDGSITTGGWRMCSSLLPTTQTTGTVTSGTVTSTTVTQTTGTGTSATATSGTTVETVAASSDGPLDSESGLGLLGVLLILSGLAACLGLLLGLCCWKRLRARDKRETGDGPFKVDDGPKEEPLSKPEQPEAMVRVTGAGGVGSLCNGDYGVVGTHGGRSKYQKVGGQSIIYYCNSWKINYQDDTSVWYYRHSDAEAPVPPLGQWINDGCIDTDTYPAPYISRLPLSAVPATEPPAEKHERQSIYSEALPKVTSIIGYAGSFVDRIELQFSSGQNRAYDSGGSKSLESTFLLGASEMLTAVEQITGGTNLGTGFMFYTNVGHTFELLGTSMAGRNGHELLVGGSRVRKDAPEGMMITGLLFEGPYLSGISTSPMQVNVPPRTEANVPPLSLERGRGAAPAIAEHMAHRPKSLPSAFSVRSPRSPRTPRTPRRSPRPRSYPEVESARRGECGLTGRWIYTTLPLGAGPLDQMYTMKDVNGSPDEYLYAESHPDGATVLGTLVADGDWVQGILYKAGAPLGHIRVRSSGPNHCVSNFRLKESDPWGKDFLGTRQDVQSSTLATTPSARGSVPSTPRSARSGLNKLPKSSPRLSEASWKLSSIRDQAQVPRVGAAPDAERGGDNSALGDGGDRGLSREATSVSRQSLSAAQLDQRYTFLLALPPQEAGSAGPADRLHENGN